jgi:hypothetical protein
METKRIVIYPKDIQRITGKSERYGRLLLKQIKQALAKKEHQYITINEFCQYAGLSVEEITSYLQD